MKARTTAEQRRAWQEVHKALTEYIVNFGPIDVKDGNQTFLLDDYLYFISCGEIWREVLDKN